MAVEETVFISHPFKCLLTKCLQRCMQSLCQGAYSWVADGLYRETMCRIVAHYSVELVQKEWHTVGPMAHTESFIEVAYHA